MLGNHFSNIMRLTDKIIQTAKKPSRGYLRLTDGDGLTLKITDRGSYFWNFRYYINGRERNMSLGRYPAMSIEAARGEALELRYHLRQGLDPLAERKKKQAAYLAEEKTQKETFEFVAREWYQLKRPEWKNEKHAQQVITTLEQFVFPFIGKKPISRISPPELLKVMEKLYDRPETASRVKQRIRAVFDYAIQTDRLSRNPAIALPKIFRSTIAKQPSLPARELGIFFKQLDTYGNPKTALALRLLILTMTRSGELRFGQWQELQGNEWHIPAERMKMNRPHIVPLSDWALEILDELRSLRRNNSPYFVTGNRNTPLSDTTLSLAMKRLGYAGRAVPHGFRATASTAMNESGLWNPDAIERQLAHTDENAVRAAYNRAEYLEERHRMMQWWADYIRKKIRVS
ncbi:tyrosine-type recombinase/integrase [Dichelobacter nodosus]|uniref:Integrase A1 n=2 Tax=Dichelobacter nodosus TaxID=870 RepID=A5EWA2_DICNV|nr:integrase arm-type DNA-binding domain-containing protein [Dichelobacter nodosus]AAB00935.1 integrase A [Dichelobacter nodosus]ABQ13930.1 integrase A1 [Dichelobacter nodosus VCS1703A]